MSAHAGNNHEVEPNKSGALPTIRLPVRGMSSSSYVARAERSLQPAPGPSQENCHEPAHSNF